MRADQKKKNKKKRGQFPEIIVLTEALLLFCSITVAVIEMAHVFQLAFESRCFYVAMFFLFSECHWDSLLI